MTRAFRGDAEAGVHQDIKRLVRTFNPLPPMLLAAEIFL